MEILCRDIAQRSAEILPTDLFWRSCTEILPGDLFWRYSTGTWWREQGTCPEILLLRAWTEILLWDLLQGSSWSSVGMSLRHFVQIALQRDFAKEPLQEPVKEILRKIFYRYLHKGNLKNLTSHLFFQRPPWMNTMLYSPSHFSL